MLDKGGKCFSLFQCRIRHTRYVGPGMTISISCLVMFIASPLGEHDGDTTAADDESKTSFFAFSSGFLSQLTTSCLFRADTPLLVLFSNLFCGLFSFSFRISCERGAMVAVWTPLSKRVRRRQTVTHFYLLSISNFMPFLWCETSGWCKFLCSYPVGLSLQCFVDHCIIIIAMKFLSRSL